MEEAHNTFRSLLSSSLDVRRLAARGKASEAQARTLAVPAETIPFVTVLGPAGIPGEAAARKTPEWRPAR